MENYCGPYWFPEKGKEWLSKDFNESCEIHDNLYKKQKGKLNADIVFILAMLIQIAYDDDKSWYFKLLLVLKAVIFFVLVLFFGFFSYYRNKRLRD